MAYVLGGDYSHWNSPDWGALVAAGHKFAYLKSTEGTAWKDSKYILHRAAARAAGLKTGAYHYFRGSWEGKLQAEHFFRSSMNDELPPAIDVEGMGNSGILQSVFASRLQECVLETQVLWGRKPVIYTSRNAWNVLIGSAPQIAALADLWTAHYTSAAQPLIPADWQGWAIWQYTSAPLDTNRMQEAFWNSLFPPPQESVTVRLDIPKDAEVIILTRK